MRCHIFAVGMLPRDILVLRFKGALLGGDIFPISVNVTKEVATGLFPWIGTALSFIARVAV